MFVFGVAFSLVWLLCLFCLVDGVVVTYFQFCDIVVYVEFVCSVLVWFACDVTCLWCGFSSVVVIACLVPLYFAYVWVCAVVFLWVILFDCLIVILLVGSLVWVGVDLLVGFCICCVFVVIWLWVCGLIWID